MPNAAQDWGTNDEAVHDWGAGDAPVHDNAPGAFEQIGTSLHNQAKGILDMAQAIVDPAKAKEVASGLVGAQLDQWNQAQEEYHKGNYGGAFTRMLGAVVPIVGPAINNASQKATEGGRPYEAATDLLAMPLLGKFAEAVPGAVRASGRIGGKVADLATHPKVMTTAGAATGALIGSPAGPVGSSVGAAAGGLLGKGLADTIAENRTIPPPEVLDRLGMTAKDFKALPDDGKAQVRELSQAMMTPKPSRPAPAVMPTGPVSTGEPVPPSGTMVQQIDQYIAQRKAAQQPQAQPVGPRTPLWAQQGNQPAVIPEGPANPTVAPQPRVIAPVAEMPAPEAAAPEVAAPEVSTGSNPPPEAYEGTYRAKRAQILADHMHQVGIEYGDSANMTPASLTDQQWETLLGKDPETGVQYRKPSQKTIDQARVRLAHKYAAGRNAASADAAKALADEMAQGGNQ